MSYAKDVLVDTDWVAEHLDDDSVRIVEVDENPALYVEGHIPGAIGFDWQADLQDPVSRDFLDAGAFGELMGSRGISNDHTVVLYGDRNNWFAAYTYWYFVYYGHNKVKLVDGPREKWLAEGRETGTEVPSYPLATFAVEAGDDSIRAYRDEIQAALENGTNLIDVRSPQEYSGELITAAGYEQEGAQRGGHIPGAASVPWSKAVNEDGTFKSAHELRGLYAEAGVLADGHPVMPTAGSVSARHIRGLSCVSCWGPRTSRTTTAPGPSGAISSAPRSRRAPSHGGWSTVPHYKAICRADFSHRVSTRLDEQGLFWFTGGLVEVGSSRRRHHLEVEATDRDEALGLIRKGIEAAGGDARDLDIV